MSQNKSALVFGASGQDGTILCSLLNQNGYHIHRAPRFQYSNSLATDISDLLTSVQPCEIYYLSAIHGSRIQDINNNYKLILAHGLVNSIIPSLIPSIISTTNIKSSFFFASSSLIFAPQLEAIDENTSPSPNCLYSNSKLYTCLNLAQARRFYNIPIVCGHFFTHESLHRSNSFLMQRIINYAIDVFAAPNKSGFRLSLGNLNQIVDIMDARDAMAAAFHCTSNYFNKNFVIGSGIPTSIETLVRIAFSILDLDYLEYVDVSENNVKTDCLARVANMRRIYATGWAPQYSLRQTISDIIEYKLSKKNLPKIHE